MRECAECQTCCTVAEVIEGDVRSAAHERCAHQCTTGCDIYERRPSRCAKFNCSWMHGLGDDSQRPDLTGAMLWVGQTPRGVIGFGVETRENAVLTTARRAVVDFVNGANLPLIITSYGKRPPEDSGDRVALRKAHVLRAFAMRGPFETDLGDDVLLYALAKARVS